LCFYLNSLELTRRWMMTKQLFPKFPGKPWKTDLRAFKQQIVIQNKIIHRIINSEKRRTTDSDKLLAELKHAVATVNRLVKSNSLPPVIPVMPPAAVLYDSMFDKPELPVYSIEGLEELNKECLDPPTLRKVVSDILKSLCIWENFVL
jgi:hypothetical protein